MPKHPGAGRPKDGDKKPVAPKRPRGKPPKGDAAKIVGFTVKMTKIEYAQWKTLAAKQGKSLSEYILEPLRERDNEHTAEKTDR